MKLRIVGILSLITLAASFVQSAHAQTFSVIHKFTFAGDGANPVAGLTLRAGILYGTTTVGASHNGSVYQVTHSGSNWATTPISFLSAGGEQPESRVVFGPDGHLYGTTLLGGSHGSGVVFDVIPPLSICKTANCFYSEKVLHNFQGPDGSSPASGDLIWDQQGNMYGTTAFGGANGKGAVFEMMRSGDGWTEAPIYSFAGGNGDGGFPRSGVIFDNNGNLFGTTNGSIPTHDGYGTVYELKYTPGTGWAETVLYNFQNGADGYKPWPSLIFDSAGNLYGAAADGGSGGGGTIFELSPSGNSWTFKLIYSFSGNTGDGCGPRQPLASDAAGNLYGTTFCDGPNHFGSVFKLTNTGNGWTYISLHDFSGGADGKWPSSNVTFDSDGTLYGTAEGGGTQDGGTIWMIKP